MGPNMPRAKQQPVQRNTKIGLLGLTLEVTVKTIPGRPAELSPEPINSWVARVSGAGEPETLQVVGSLAGFTTALDRYLALRLRASLNELRRLEQEGLPLEVPVELDPYVGQDTWEDVIEVLNTPADLKYREALWKHCQAALAWFRCGGHAITLLEELQASLLDTTQDPSPSEESKS